MECTDNRRMTEWIWRVADQCGGEVFEEVSVPLCAHSRLIFGRYSLCRRYSNPCRCMTPREYRERSAWSARPSRIAL